MTEKPVGKAVAGVVAGLAGLFWLGGLVTWLDAPDEPVRQDQATMAVMDAAAAVDAAPAGQAISDMDAEYACGVMLSERMSTSAKAHPDFKRAARGCVTYYMVSTKAAHNGKGILPYVQGETLSPQGLLLRLEASDLMVDDAQRQELAALRKELAAPSGSDW